MGTMVPLQTVTLTGTAASVTFSDIPQTYKTLRLIMSARSSGGFVSNVVDSIRLYVNGDTSSVYTTRCLYGSGSSATSDAYWRGPFTTGSGATASTFGNSEATFPNYTGSGNKTISIDGVSENNAASSFTGLEAMLYTGTNSGITSLLLVPESTTTFVAGSTFYLYGIGDQ